MVMGVKKLTSKLENQYASVKKAVAVYSALYGNNSEAMI